MCLLGNFLARAFQSLDYMYGSICTFTQLRTAVEGFLLSSTACALMAAASTFNNRTLSESQSQTTRSREPATEYYDLRGRPLLGDRASGVPCSRATLDSLAPKKSPVASVLQAASWASSCKTLEPVFFGFVKSCQRPITMSA